jgi:hypothetical protein
MRSMKVRRSRFVLVDGIVKVVKLWFMRGACRVSCGLIAEARIRGSITLLCCTIQVQIIAGTRGSRMDRS